MRLETSDVPVLITCYNRVETVRLLVAWLEEAGQHRIVLVDNASTYEPLLSFYAETPHQVVRLDRNIGHLAVWEADLLAALRIDGPYVVTDCDVVPDEAAPHDALDRFAELLLRYSDVDKVGFGLRIDDLPDSYQFRSDVVEWESQFWEVELEPGVFRADIDTTFALYRPSVVRNTHRALRTGPPYVARHVPWYKDSLHLSAEDAYYRDHALAGVTNWDADALPDSLQSMIDARREARAAAGPDRAGREPTDASSGAAPPASPASPDVGGDALFELVALDLAQQLAAESEARRSAERELAAVRASRSYRWMEPVRGLRGRMTAHRGGEAPTGPEG